MKKKIVIYLFRSYLNKKNFNRYGFNNWINHGWTVYIYNITKFLNKEFWHHMNKDKESLEFKNLKIFNNLNEILQEIKKLNGPAVFIDLLKFSSTEIKIRKICQTKGILIKLKLQAIPIYIKKKKYF